MRIAMLTVFGLMLLAGMSVGAEPPDAHRFGLTSARGDFQRDSFQVSWVDLKNTGEHPWSVKTTRLHGGKQDGVQLVTINNGTLQITVVPTRGMSILEVKQGDFRLGWDSPVEEVVHPKYIRLDSRGGLGWLEGFNEWMVRCGLEFAGHPGKDEFIDNTGAQAEMDLTLHGKIGNIPASEVSLSIDKQAPHTIRLRGVVYEKMFFGPKLKLETEISTVPGSSTLSVTDAVTNEGAGAQEMQLIYHTNYGTPLLEKGATAVVAARRIAPMNETAATAIEEYSRYKAPTRGFIEQVYLIHPYADADGTTSALLKNAAGDRGASITWSTKELPYFTIWKNTAAVEDGYVTGFEPATCFPYNRKVERAAGRVPKMKPGETRRFALEFSLHDGRESVEAVERRIASILGGKPTVVAEEPPVGE